MKIQDFLQDIGCTIQVNLLAGHQEINTSVFGSDTLSNENCHFLKKKEKNNVKFKRINRV